MAQYRITDTLLTRIATAVRRITGGSGKLSPTSIAEALEDASVVKTNGTTATASDIVNGKTAYVNGERVTGTIRNQDSTIERGYITNDSTSTISIGKYSNNQIGIELVFSENTLIKKEKGLYAEISDLSLIDKGTWTITPSTSDKTILSNDTKYFCIATNLVVKGDANLVSENILSGKSIFGVEGNVVTQTFRSGTSEPSNSLGDNGDWYLVTEG